MLKKLHPYLLLSPALFLVTSIFAVGLVMGFMQSLGSFPALGLQEFTLRYYNEVFADPNFRNALGFSLHTALTSAVLATILGFVLAYGLMRNRNQRAIEQLLYQLPIIVPHTVAAFLVFSVLGQSGYLSRVAFHLGLISDIAAFPELLYDRLGIGIILAYVWKEVPFVALVVYGILQSVDARYAQSSKNLGASSIQTLMHVTLPMCAPALSTSFIIIFAYSFGAFEVPFLLGPTSPKALPVLAYLAYIEPDLSNRPYAMAINMVIAGLTVLLVFLYSRCYGLLRRMGQWVGGEE